MSLIFLKQQLLFATKKNRINTRPTPPISPKVLCFYFAKRNIFYTLLYAIYLKGLAPSKMFLLPNRNI